MKRIKSIFSILLSATMVLTMAACGNKTDETKSASSETTVASTAMAVNGSEKDEAKTMSKKVIYTTFFPVYDLTKRIVGDKMTVKTIISGSQQPHDFELRASDMKEISTADLIVYNGANMEAFIPDLKNVVANDGKFLDLSQGLELLVSSEAKTEADKMDSVNPHTWLSVKNAIHQLKVIAKKMIDFDPENKDTYKQNLLKSVEEFQNLDAEFTQALSQINKEEKYFVVSHAAFNYLAKDYGLKQVAVTGISPEEEPSAQQLKKIADFVKEKKIGTIFFEGKATPKVAETLAKETGTKTATIFTMENLTDEEVEIGYIGLMQHNLRELVKSFAD